jgi:hypothetical protein
VGEIRLTFKAGPGLSGQLLQIPDTRSGSRASSGFKKCTRRIGSWGLTTLAGAGGLSVIIFVYVTANIFIVS